MKEYTIIPMPISILSIDKSMMTYRRNMGQRFEMPCFFWYIKGAPTLKYLDSGWCAQLGITASLMAQIGTTAFDDILDDNRHFWKAYGIDDCDFEAMTHNLGEEWHITDTTYKPWPGIRYSHYPLWLFLKIKEENHLSAENIRKVVIRMGPMGTTPRFANQSPQGSITCQFNHPHAIAMAALNVEPGPKWYSQQTMDNKDVIDFRKRVEVILDPKLAKIDLPKGKLLWKLPTAIEVQTPGKTFHSFTEYTKGDPWTEETYFSDDELKQKFLVFASTLFAESEKWREQLNSLIEIVFNAETILNVADLCNNLGPKYQV